MICLEGLIEYENFELVRQFGYINTIFLEDPTQRENLNFCYRFAKIKPNLRKSLTIIFDFIDF